MTAPMPANTPSANPLGLKDIHVPEQISNFPVAYGWWLLAATLLVLIVFLLFKIRQKAKLARHQKQALKQLKNSPHMSNNNVITLLKWAAMQYFPRSQLAKLYGGQFQQFLVTNLSEKHQNSFNELAGNNFTEQYQRKDNNKKDTNDNLHQAALLWLTQALPPKVATTQKATTSTLPSEHLGAKI